MCVWHMATLAVEAMHPEHSRLHFYMMTQDDIIVHDG